jgi:DNA-3-methyladenine glycosylase II
VADATAELARRDGSFASLVERAGPWKLSAPNPEGPYAALVRSIAFQQLAGAAAATIHGRFRALIDGPVTPEAVLALPDEAMAGAGLSGSKRAAIRDLSEKVADGSVRLDRLGRMSDEDIIAMLVTVRGIGVWTAQMLLLFQLRRPDVWPTGDLAVRAGYGLMHGLDEPPTAKALEALGDPYRPWRSVVAHYCWEAVHLSRAAGLVTPD